jgi:hypothetical protein
MSIGKPSLIALAVLACLGTAAQAQGVGFVPGGWSPQVGFQSFAGPGVAGFGAGVGYGYGYGYGYGSPVAGYGVTLPGLSPNVPGAATRPSYNYYTPSSQATVAVDPLIGAIRKSTGTARKRGR